MITAGIVTFAGFSVIIFVFFCLYEVGQLPKFLTRKKSNNNEAIAQGWKEVTTSYDQLMYDLTPLKDMNVDELNNVLCRNCGLRYAVHAANIAHNKDGVKCVRHTKHSEINHYLKTAPVIKPEPVLESTKEHPEVSIEVGNIGELVLEYEFPNGSGKPTRLKEVTRK